MPSKNLKQGSFYSNIVVMTDIAEAMADKPDPFGVNVAYDPRDASKVLTQKQ